jgi:hypothetical protein
MTQAAPEESRGGPINYSDAALGDLVPVSRSSSSLSIRAVLGGRRSASWTMRRIVNSSRSSASMVSMSRSHGDGAAHLWRSDQKRVVDR